MYMNYNVINCNVQLTRKNNLSQYVVKTFCQSRATICLENTCIPLKPDFQVS